MYDAPAFGPPPSAPSDPKPGRLAWLRAHRRGIGAILVTIGLLVVGMTGGWWAKGRWGEKAEPPPIVVDRPVVEPRPAASASGMPNIIGLPSDRAQQVLFDAGISVDRIRRTAVAAAGPEGLVVTQDPKPGADVDGRVTVGLSTAATMPDLVGRSVEDAQRALERLGADVAITARYDPNVDEDVVSASAPAAGEALTVNVELTVGAAPSGAFLAELESVDGGCDIDDEASIDTKSLPSSIVCSADTEPRTVRFVLGRRVDRLDATLGQDNRNDLGYDVRFVIRADGRVLFDQVIGRAKAVPVELPLSGVLDLELEATLIAAEDDCCPNVDAVFGSARLVGSKENIDQLLADT
jgi:hypothetical protein